MGSDLQTRWARWWARRSRVGRVSLWLLAAFWVAVFAERLGVARGLDTVVITFSSIALFPLLLILLYRWFVYRVLWKVRNRLILTYLLMGLAPVVLFATLAGIAGYLLMGQYATDTALSLVDQALSGIRDEAGTAAVFGSSPAQSPARSPARTAGVGASAGLARTAGVGGAAGGMAGGGVGEGSPMSLMELRGNAWVPLAGAQAGPLTSGAPPAWLHPGFQGIVVEKGQLFLCSEVSAPRDGRTVVVLGSRPLNTDELNAMAEGLGKITLTQGFSRVASGADKNDVDVVDLRELTQEDEPVFDTVSSDPLKNIKHLYLDPPVLFTAPIPVTRWETGERPARSMMVVVSRPSLLYAHLFATSTDTGIVVRVVLIGIALFFALLELMALLMAASLSRTITRSVAELYRGTREIDAGHLEHRIPVRQKDQLAALAGSFNRMAASVSELLVQQREKERLLNELAIAKEVQATLFPHSPASLPGFEVHGVCVPARTVGGDYFDFILKAGVGGGVTLALGDISGKGIAAALLMSSLHSADRAFSLGWGAEERLPPSPALLLKLLNEHLFRSTQSARYATLFLAFYDAGTRRLTYANGGHLPPLVISEDGTVRRLDCGGSVVGLMDGLEYEEATVLLEPGELLVAFTDGLTEPENGVEEFGEERLLEFVRRHRELPLTALATMTLKAVQEWFGEREQPDDMTILLARQL